MDALETVSGMENYALATEKPVCQSEWEGGVLEVELGGDEGDEPNMSSKSLRRLVSWVADPDRVNMYRTETRVKASWFVI
jgi:hypothetical protein